MGGSRKCGINERIYQARRFGLRAEVVGEAHIRSFLGGESILRVIFMGTPQFAIPSLKMLIEEKHDYDVVGVITQPERKKDRKGTLIQPPVKELAIKHGIRVIQPDSIRSDSVFCEISELEPDLFVTVAYGGILDKRLLDLPRFGCVNVHASLLPKYRGPAPIQWAIINGNSETGVTIMLTDTGVDTGCVLSEDYLTITDDMYYPDVYDALSKLGALALKRTLPLWVDGKITPVPQNEAIATKARMLIKEDGRINFNKSAKEIACLVRGVSPWPGAYAQTDCGKMKVLRACVIDETLTYTSIGNISVTDAVSVVGAMNAACAAEASSGAGVTGAACAIGTNNAAHVDRTDNAVCTAEATSGAADAAGTVGAKAVPGTVLKATCDGLVIQCGDGAVSITELQFENCRSMNISECWHNLKTNKFYTGE